MRNGMPFQPAQSVLWVDLLDFFKKLPVASSIEAEEEELLDQKYTMT